MKNITFWYYLGANILAAVGYFFYSAYKVARFNLRIANREESKIIPSPIYYGMKFLSTILKIIFIIVFLPAYLSLVRPMRSARRSEVCECFSKHTPYTNNNIINFLKQSVPKDEIKKVRFKCPFWDSFNTKQYNSCSYSCIHYCPLFKENYPYFLFSDEEEEEYNSSNSKISATVDLSNYGM